MEFTTLEQRCTTLANPHSTKRHVKPTVVPPDVPVVNKPNPESRRARALRADPNKPPETRGRKALGPASKRLQAEQPPPRTDEPKAVDRNEPSARDRIEDMKFEREQRDYGWDE
jgi:hypothetical protein